LVAWACSACKDANAYTLPEVPRLPILVSFFVPLFLLIVSFGHRPLIAAHGRGPPLLPCSPAEFTRLDYGTPAPTFRWNSGKAGVPCVVRIGTSRFSRRTSWSRPFSVTRAVRPCFGP
jgi:hypothetical protein